jgi:ribonuclease HI
MLTADPSYEQYLEEHESNRVQQGDRIMVPLLEIGGKYRQSWMDACIEKTDHWVMIARKGDISTEQIRALEQHGKLAGRVKPARRGCLEKGWWKTGERKRIKGRYEHFIWEKRDREKDKGKGAEDAEVVEVETMDTAGGIEAGKLWDQYLDPPTSSLQTYLRALPSGLYYGIGRCLVATDGSLKLRRRERERETMGAGVAWQQDVAEHRGRGNHPEGEQTEGGGRGSIHGTGAHNVSSRVAGNLSSTRAELAAIAQAVKMAPIEKELVILIDSAAAIRRLTWYRRKDFRPHPRKTKDFDIVREIIESLDERGRNGARTTMVKVHGHTGTSARSSGRYGHGGS